MGSSSSNAPAATSFVQGLEHGFALVGSQIFDDVGNVGGMEFGQPLVGNLELDAAGGIGLDEVDEIPGDIAGRNAQQQGAQGSRWDHSL